MSGAPRPRTAAAVIGALALLGLAGCGSSTTPAAVESFPISTAPPAAPADPPARPGLLVSQERPFTEAEVRRLRHQSEVTRLALIGYGQVRMYGDRIPTATVDPATYRSFTPDGTRDATTVWKVVADGKALVSHAVGDRDHLPLDVTVPAGRATVRIAGLATTVPGVDMVVSSATGERIGVPFGNGLVVAVSGDPERASAKVRAVLGARPVIRRIAPLGGPALPAVTPAVPPATPSVVPPGAPPPAAPAGGPAALP
ncbi:hypothetical protein FB559_6081 [Actinoallomurus bryophytorum]|uniref:Lipoprotein n=1 Tax=Actinoallomurus bryophytorum TaxID=1490222 RepID=A0A543CTK2_9ACTN|nr:hypothetical protein [Actinoallomurus bryophytorum]TQM00369.1 hypothetical protein FB559_6081 [Actinoallomurus bryophytorum]